jgi:hypothetical protein
MILLACSWILWGNSVSTRADVWVPADSYERLDECKRGAERFQKNADNRKSDRLISYVCLPDTINPMATKSN